MEIIKASKDNYNKKELYKLTESQGISIKDVENGTSIEVENWLLYKDVNSKGEEHNILSIISAGEKFSTISATFIDSFYRIVELMGSDPYSIIIKHGTSKGGRKYVTCELDCD